MGGRIDKVVGGVRRLFEDMAVDVREERVIRYIVNELRNGRSFDAVMADPYVMNNTDASTRARIIENPQTLRSIENEIAAEFQDYQRSL